MKAAQKNSKKKAQDKKGAQHLLMLSGALFVSSVVLFSATLVYFNKSKQLRTTTYASSQPFSTGKPVRMGKVEVTLSNVHFEAGSPPFIAPEGSTYVLAELSIHNTTDAPLQILPSVDTYVKSTDGSVSPLAVYAYQSPFRAGELPVGETIRGEVGYLVKKDAAAKLYVDATWSGGVLPFKLDN